MNLFSVIKSRLLGELSQMQVAGILPADAAFAAVDVMPPREAAHGDMATNAAMVLAAKAGRKPK